jgi:hypothetical protein
MHVDNLLCAVFFGERNRSTDHFKLNCNSIYSAFSRKRIRHPLYAPCQIVLRGTSRGLVLVWHVLLLQCLWKPKLQCAISSLSLRHVSTVSNHPHRLIAQLALVEPSTFTEAYTKWKHDQYGRTLHTVRISCLPSYLRFIRPFVK